MAINASLFVVPENKFEGLDKATNILMQQRKYAQDVAQEKQRNKTVDYKLLESSYDPKDYFTGTVYDGRVGELINGMMQKGRDLINQGVDYATMKGILAADANKLNQYSTKAKLLSAQKKEAAKLLADAGGVDMNKFSKAYDEEAYYETDPQTGEKKLKDINDVDETINYADQLLRNKPELVTDASGIDKFVKEQYKMPIKTSFDTNIYDAGGTLNRAKVATKYANYLQPEYDNRGALVGYVPKYEQATDNGDKIYEGKNEVRLLDRNEFERLPANVLNHIKTLTKEHLNEYKDATGNKIDLGSYQAENLARAIAYKELNKRKSWDYENIEVKNKPSSQALTVRYGLGNTPQKQESVGNAFDVIGDLEGVKGTFTAKDGLFYNNDNTLKSGTIFIGGENIPAIWKSAIKAGGLDPDILKSGVSAEIKDGKIVSISNKKLGTISRETMQDVYQPMMDKEPKGTPKLKFKKPIVTKNMEAYKTDTTPNNWKNNGDGTYTYLPTGQKVDSKSGKLIK